MSEAPQTIPPQTVSRKATLMVSILSLLIVLMIGLFWRQTWFGRKLTNVEISEYLNDEDKPRRTQHALAQISDRLSRGDHTVARWYPAVIALAEHSLPQLRVNVAWLMGQDSTELLFHEKLREMLTDKDPLVRRNAALSLIRFGDNAGHDELLSMLRNHTVHSPHQGVLVNRLVEGDVVDVGTLLARVESEIEQEPLEIRSLVPGIVQKRLLEDGFVISVGTPVMLLGPDESHIFEALRGLYLIGTEEDLEIVRQFFRPREGMSSNVVKQAQLTAVAIRERTKSD